MKALLVVAILVVGVIAVALSQSAFQQAAAQTASNVAKPDKVTGFYCDRLALTPEKRRRHFDELGPQMRKLVMGVREMPDGYEFEFPGDSSTIQTVAEWTDGERSCCPFFKIEMRFEHDAPLRLRISGKEGVKEFIKADFFHWFKS